MINVEAARKLALSFPEVEEQDHWGKPSYRVKKKIFATVWLKEKKVVLKLSAIDQSVFCDFKGGVFYPVAGAWGKQGWTMVDLTKVRKDMFKDAMELSFKTVAPKAIVKKYFGDKE
jgi:hypothetical protein